MVIFKRGLRGGDYLTPPARPVHVGLWSPAGTEACRLGALVVTKIGTKDGHRPIGPPELALVSRSPPATGVTSFGS
jgi:hypothetical protein